MAVERLNPEGLYVSPAFSQGTVASGSRTVYVGGQNGIDAQGRLADGLSAQTERALHNVIAVLAAAGAGPDDVVKMHIHLVAGTDANEGFAASQRVWTGAPTAVTVVFVAGLGLPGALVEIDAIAIVD
jgi:enamine deaminase RidA (YjgF/YER057c/UK114 family)